MAVVNKMAPAVASGYLEPYDSWAHRVALLRFVQDIPLKRDHPSWQSLVEIEKGLVWFQKTPMLILWGGRDFCFTRHFYEEWLQRFPDAENHFFHDAGHYILEDAFDRLAPLVENFFNRAVYEL